MSTNAEAAVQFALGVVDLHAQNQMLRAEVMQLKKRVAELEGRGVLLNRVRIRSFNKVFREAEDVIENRPLG